MIFSIPKEGGHGYTYVEAPGAFPPTAQFRKPRGRMTGGAWTLDAFTEPIPTNGRVVGDGALPLGMIATAKTPSGIAGFPDVNTAGGRLLVDVIGGLIVAAIARRLFR